MFKARFWFYWCDDVEDYREITANNISDILEYVYRIYKESHPSYGKNFYCRGIRQRIPGGLSASNVLPQRRGYCGQVTLDQITYSGENGSVIVFRRNKYMSPKTSAAFDKFREIVKAREQAVAFGEF